MTGIVMQDPVSSDNRLLNFHDYEIISNKLIISPNYKLVFGQRKKF